MNKENQINFTSLGVSDSQVEMLINHLDAAEKYIIQADPGNEKAYSWLFESLHSALSKEDADLLYKIAVEAKIDSKVEYLEQGYDSCQSHRKLAKIVGEAILSGGLHYEAGLLGLQMEGETGLSSDELVRLKQIANRYGAAQDFLFPGVTPSSSETPTLGELAYLALSGKPETTVRSLTGVGGLRFDKDWNYATDLVTFVNLKVTEDKRYYPGIGVFYFLSVYDPEIIPAVAALKMSQPKLYLAIVELASVLKKTPKSEYGGVSVLCSAYLPPWSELKKVQGLITDASLDLAQAFHSPSYEFVVLKTIFEKVAKEEVVDDFLIASLADLIKKVGHCWSFNSTIHLPWTAQLAGLSNDLIGRITNTQGDHCIRYGVGYGGGSLEIREYFFGGQRKFPQGLAGQKAYGVRWYPNSEVFEGGFHESTLDFSDKFVQEIVDKGFLAAALGLLKSKHEI